jgi:polar amino acid transport system substrate-binding protein
MEAAMHYVGVIFLSLFLTFSPTSKASDLEKVIVIAGDDYCPLTCNPASGHNGIGYDLAKHVYGEIGWEVRYEFVPFQRAIKYFNVGRVDLVPGVAKDGNPDFLNAELSNVPIMSPRMCFYTRAGDAWIYQDTRSLLQGKLGVVAGYFYWPELLSYIGEHKKDGKIDTIASDNSMELSIRKLALKRFDYFAELRPVVEYQLMKLNMKSDIRESTCMMNLPLYMAFRANFNGAKELNAHWDKAIIPFLKSKAGKGILSRYGLTFKSIME